MTLWLDGLTVREYFIRPVDGNGTIVTNKQIGERHKVTIKYESSLTLDEFDFSNINQFLGAIGDGNPEVQLESKNNYLHLSVIADENVYREEGF